jgi:hypothetical protein
MILRRIAEAFRRQDWFTVFVETMIVVLGVFLGLQVNNWNQSRADQNTVARHLTEISLDLNSYLEVHEDLYASALARIAAVDYIYKEAFGVRLPGRIMLSTQETQVPKTQEFPPRSARQSDGCDRSGAHRRFFAQRL